MEQTKNEIWIYKVAKKAEKKVVQGMVFIQIQINIDIM